MNQAVFVRIAVPIASAIIGAVVTVIASYAIGTPNLDASVLAVVSDNKMSATEKRELIKLFLSQDDDFWSLMRYTAGSLLMPLIILVMAYARRIG